MDYIFFNFAWLDMDLFEDVHATALLFALVGATVALSATLPPRFTATDVLLSLTRETRTIDVIVHEAVRFVPSAVLHVITAVPFPTALTTPVAVTVATFLFDEDHTTFLLLADAGPTAYFSVYVDPFNIVFWYTPNFIDVAGCTTFTVQVAYFPLPSLAVQVIVAVPFATAVRYPFDTFTIFGFEVFQVTFLLLALAGKTVAASVYLLPFARDNLVADNVIFFTGWITLTTYVDRVPTPSDGTADITVTPLPTAVTVPSEATVATASFDVDHVISLLFAVSGWIVYVFLNLAPTLTSFLASLKDIPVIC